MLTKETIGFSLSLVCDVTVSVPTGVAAAVFSLAVVLSGRYEIETPANQCWLMAYVKPALNTGAHELSVDTLVGPCRTFAWNTLLVIFASVNQTRLTPRPRYG